MKKTARWMAFGVQKLLFHVARVCCGLARSLLRRPKDRTWVVGVDEIAGNVERIGCALGSTAKVCFQFHHFYAFKYDFFLNIANPRLHKLARFFYGPLLLGYLVTRYNRFFYIGGTGFFMPGPDGREFEFQLLHGLNKKIVCFFVGSEIRSHVLMAELSKKLGLDVITTYQEHASIGISSAQREALRRKLAESAERYAAAIFNAPVDQIAYFERPVFPFMYFYPDERFARNDEKFARLDRIKIMHVPSTPLIKGTPLVRAAIKKLQNEGYRFDYVELIGVANAVVLEELKSAHIVLNEFYAFVPGLFGVEAMAAHCALLVSADERIETSLPAGSNEAWIVTRYYEIYEHLKALLDAPERIRKYADSGFVWAQKHAAMTQSGAKLRAILESLEVSTP